MGLLNCDMLMFYPKIPRNGCVTDARIWPPVLFCSTYYANAWVGAYRARARALRAYLLPTRSVPPFSVLAFAWKASADRMSMRRASCVT